MKSSFPTFGVIILSIIVVTIVYASVFCEIRSFHHNAVRCPGQPYRSPLPNHAQSAANSSETVNVIHHDAPSRAVSNTSSNMRRNQRGLTTTLVLLLVFLVCFLPSFINEIYLMIGATGVIKKYEYVFSLGELLWNLPLICSALDPLLYSYRLKDIKLSYLRLFCCYNDNYKANLPPLVAGRTRPRHNVQIYHPTHRRSIAGTHSSLGPVNSTPWSQRIARATGLYIERIRKFSSTQSNLDQKARKNTPMSAPFYASDPMHDEHNRHLLLASEDPVNRIYFTTPSKLPLKSSRFISAPKMVLCPWQFANKSLRDSWIKDERSSPVNNHNRPLNVLERNHKMSTYSSTEGGHSGSIDSANTNSTSMSNSFHNQRSKSIDNASLHLSSYEKRIIQIEKSILEND